MASFEDGRGTGVNNATDGVPEESRTTQLGNCHGGIGKLAHAHAKKQASNARETLNNLAGTLGTRKTKERKSSRPDNAAT